MTTNGLAQPSAGPRLSATSSEPTPSASSNEPSTSTFTSRRRAVSGRMKKPTTNAINVNGTWATKIARQPMSSTIGPPRHHAEHRTAGRHQRPVAERLGAPLAVGTAC